MRGQPYFYFAMTKFLLTAVVLLALSSAAQAQSSGPAGPVPAATPVPLDGGASLLLASGVAYGLRHLRQRRRA